MEEKLKEIGIKISEQCGMFEWTHPNAITICVMVYKELLTIEEAIEIVEAVNRSTYSRK